MDRNEVIIHLHNAKESHIDWVQKAQMLINGFKVKEDSIPVDSSMCRFGKWFYSDAQKLNVLRNNPLESMQKIEQLHINIHDTYLNIFKIYYSTNKQNFFSKLFGKKKKITKEDTIQAKEHFFKLEGISKNLIFEIDRLERRIEAIKDIEFNRL